MKCETTEQHVMSHLKSDRINTYNLVIISCDVIFAREKNGEEEHSIILFCKPNIFAIARGKPQGMTSCDRVCMSYSACCFRYSISRDGSLRCALGKVDRSCFLKVAHC